MTISISNDGSYFSIGYIDYNYITPDILVLGTTSVNSVSIQSSVKLSLIPSESQTGTICQLVTEISLSGVDTSLTLGNISNSSLVYTDSNILSVNTSSIQYSVLLSLPSNESSTVISDVLSEINVDLIGNTGSSSIGNEPNNTTLSISGNAAYFELSNIIVDLDTSISSNSASSELDSLYSNTSALLDGIDNDIELSDLFVEIESNIVSEQIQLYIGSIEYNISLDVTGYEGIGNAGYLSSNIEVNLYGELATTDVGLVISHIEQISEGIEVSISGVEVNFELGEELPQDTILTIWANTNANAYVGDISSELTSLLESDQVTSSIGNVEYSKLETISGVESFIEVSSLIQDSNVNLSSIYLYVNTSNIDATRELSLTGIESTSYLDSLLELDSNNLIGNESNANIGSLGFSKSETLELTRVSVNVTQGRLTNDITIPIYGNSVTGSIVSESFTKTLILYGVQSEFSIGRLLVSNSSTVNLSSVKADSAIQSTSNIISTAVNSYLLLTNPGYLNYDSHTNARGISTRLDQNPLYATYQLESTGNESTTSIGNLVSSLSIKQPSIQVIGTTGNFNKYSTTSIFGSSSYVQFGIVRSNLLATLYNPTLITSIGYIGHFSDVSDIYYYGPIQFELINSNIIPFAVSLPIETGFDDTKEIETKFNTVFTSDTEFKNTKSFKGVCL